MLQNQPLTFEEFAERDSGIPRYNNLILYFRDSDLSRMMRNRPAFQRFQAEQPDLEKKLHEAISAMNPNKHIPEKLKPYDMDLYDFYLIMRGYGVPDNELIGDI